MSRRPSALRPRALIAPLLAALALVAASCAPTAAPGPAAPAPAQPAAAPTPAVRPPAQADKLIIALPFPGFDTFDPILETSDRKYDLEQLYDYTVGSAADGKLSTDLGLASEWSQSTDGASWTFKLRPGTLYHNGDEVVAEDAKFSLERVVTDKRAVVTYVSLFKSMIDKVDVVDKYTYTVRTKGIQPLLPHFLSRLSISIEGLVLPKKYYDQVGEKVFPTKPVGSGPYKLASFEPGQRIELESVGKHRIMPNPPAKRLVFVNVKEATTRMALLRTREADIAPIPLTSKKDMVKAGLRVVGKPEDFFTTIHIHETWDTKYPVSKKQVRQAMAYAIDKKTILETLYQGEGFLTGNHATTLAFEWVPNFPPVPYDPQKAKALLAEAGYPNGFDLTLYSYVRAPVDSMEVIEAIASMWNAVGIRAKVTPIDYAVFRTKWQSFATEGGVDVLTHATAFSQVAIINTIHHSKGLLTMTRDPELDRLIEATVKGKTIDEIRKFGQQMMRYMMEEQAYEITIAALSTAYGIGPKVATWQPSILPNSLDVDRITVNP